MLIVPDQITSKISEECVLEPVSRVLNINSPKHYKNQDIESTLNTIFPEQKRQDSDLKLAKSILGKKAENFTETELQDLITDVNYLAQTWLDEFEMTIFKGKTLQEFLHNKGGL